MKMSLECHVGDSLGFRTTEAAYFKIYYRSYIYCAASNLGVKSQRV